MRKNGHFQDVTHLTLLLMSQTHQRNRVVKVFEVRWDESHPVGPICMCVGVGKERSIWLNAAVHLLMTRGWHAVREDTHLGLNQPRFRSRARSRLVEVSRVYRNTPVPVVQGGKIILVLVILADPGWVLGLQGFIWGGFPEEKLRAWTFKGCHHLAACQPEAARRDLQQQQQQHRGKDFKRRALVHLEGKGRGILNLEKSSPRPGVIFVLVGHGRQRRGLWETKEGQLLYSWRWKNQQGNKGEI